MPAYGTGVMPMIRFGMNMIGNFSVGYFSTYLDKILIGWRYGSFLWDIMIGRFICLWRLRKE